MRSTLHHQTVDSTNIRSISYVATSAVLEMTFKNGRTYKYDAVPTEVHVAFLNAASNGSYHHANIKVRYPHRQVG
ncbi:KTSC domain-containing protein [Lentzea waywayandensis]|uniref:KTSC domain-containing protein n=1 Tax=Lentzea waywayandensis TaxID=84724 RepID=A0A1I6FFG9_9PSEU|nr:KTSC domain-containing protein [Lentzea waywayandensis]SFR28695.1 KTSC domain-containing protein [Lentzea waywayandensis]